MNFENTPSIPPGRLIFIKSSLFTMPGGNNFELKLVPKLATPPPTLMIALYLFNDKKEEKTLILVDILSANLSFLIKGIL